MADIGGSGQHHEHAPLLLRPPSRTTVVQKIFLDFIVLTLLFIPILVLFIGGVPFKRGFNCDDDSLRYPFYDNSTISGTTNTLYSTVIPIFVFVLNEYTVTEQHLSRDRSGNPNKFWSYYTWHLYLQLVPFFFAAITSQLVTDISKYTTGRLRPHFIDLCRPRILSNTPYVEVITRESNCREPHAFVVDYECSTSHLNGYRKEREGHLSFMSGHSAFAAVCLVYLVIYIQIRARWLSVGLLRPVIQALLLCLVLYTGLTRISDYQHHWSDVLIGLLQGTIIAVLTAFFVSDMFKVHSYHPKIRGLSTNSSHKTTASSDQSRV